MTRVLVGLWLAVLSGSGCVRTRTDVRVERGNTLRTYEQQGAASPGAVRAQVSLQWPEATLRFERFELCPVQQVEEYEEQRITDRTSNGGVASLGMGVTTALIGGGLLLALPLFSDTPDTRRIDAGGRYGPSSRQYARGFGVGFLVVGVPSLGAAAWELAGTGERVERAMRTQVTEREPVRCNARPAQGEVQLFSTRGPLAPTRVEGGAVVLNAEALKGISLSGAAVNGEDVVIDAEDWDRLQAFQSCAQAGPTVEPQALSALESSALRARLDAARGCDEVPGAPIEWATLLEKELGLRRSAERGAQHGPRVESFDEAVATWAPALIIPSAQTRVDALADTDRQKGAAVLVTGTLVDFLEANIAVLEVEARHLWLYLDAAQPWTAELKAGAKLEVLGVVMGRQEVGKLEAPLLRVIWARPSP